jgi:glycosyltransferase involved in cell wall biosynthesis
VKSYPNKKTALVFDPGFGGHHLKYVSYVIDALYTQGYRVIFASGIKTFKSVEYELILRKCEKKFTAAILRCSRRGGIIGRVEKSWWLFKLATSNKASIVWVPYLDGLFYVFGVAGMVFKLFGWHFLKMYGILMHCDFVYPIRKNFHTRKLKELLCRTIIRSQLFSRVFVIDEVAYDKLRVSVGTPNLCLCPDPVDAPPSVDIKPIRNYLGIPIDAKVIGVFGLLNEGKGVDYLVRTFLKCGPRKNEFLLLMGLQSPSLRSKLQRAMESTKGSENIIIVNRFVEEELLLLAINSVDVVALIYPYHKGSASFLIRAAAANKPVLGSNSGWIGYIMRKYGLGYSCNVMNEKDLKQGIEWSFGNPKQDYKDVKTFSAKHTVDEFLKVISDQVPQP